MAVRVAIVEDNHSFRDGLAQLVSGTPGYQLVGLYPDCREMLAEVARARPEVVLMDIALPGMSGIEGVQKLKELLPAVEVLMLTVFEDEKKIFDSICSGASGYLLKKTPPAKLLEAILDVKEGGAPMTPKIARQVLEAFQTSIPEKSVKFDLSERELSVLKEMTRGASYQMIADSNYISIDTVRSHVKNIYEKLHVNSKAAAVAVAMKNRLVE